VPAGSSRLRGLRLAGRAFGDLAAGALALASGRLGREAGEGKGAVAGEGVFGCTASSKPCAAAGQASGGWAAAVVLGTRILCNKVVQTGRLRLRRSGKACGSVTGSSRMGPGTSPCSACIEVAVLGLTARPDGEAEDTQLAKFDESGSRVRMEGTAENERFRGKGRAE